MLEQIRSDRVTVWTGLRKTTDRLERRYLYVCRCASGVSETDAMRVERLAYINGVGGLRFDAGRASHLQHQMLALTCPRNDARHKRETCRGVRFRSPVRRFVVR